MIEYVFDFYAILPVEIPEAEDIVQRFKVVVKIDQDFTEIDDDVPWLIRSMLTGKNISLMVEYSDYAVGRSLQGCVQDWVKSLKQQKASSFFKFIDSKSEPFSAFVPFIFSGSILYGMSKFKVNDLEALNSHILTSISLAVFLFVVGKFLTVNFFRQIAQIRPLTFIKITNGDMARCEKIMHSRNRKLSFASVIAIAIILNVITNVFSNAIWDYIK